MQRFFIMVAFLLFAVLFLAACGSSNGGDGGGGGDDPGFTEEEFDTATDDFGEDLTEVGTKVGADAGVAAAMDMPTFTFSRGSIFGGEELTLSLSSMQPFSEHELATGVYEWNEATLEWDEVGASANLELNWQATDPDTGASLDAELVVDWTAGGSATQEVLDESGNPVEVPTEANMTLTVDGDTAADVDAEFDWYSDSTCTDGILEPTRVAVDGYLGVDATVTLTDVGTQVTSDTVSTSGDVTLAADGDEAGFGWDVSATGTIERAADCFVEDFEVDSGSVEFSAYADPAAEPRSTFGFEFGFDDIVLGADDDLESVDLSGGKITVDGSTAVTFSGTLDDADDDGIWGDNVTVNFSGGTSKSLEAVIEDSITTTAGVARVLSLLP